MSTITRRSFLTASAALLPSFLLATESQSTDSNFCNNNATPRFFENVSRSVGRTPLVRLNRIVSAPNVTVLAKMEGLNPTFSAKCRIGAAMIMSAEAAGQLKPGMEIIEATSGNTGIALASAAAVRGYSLTLTMPETMSIERQRILKMFGVNLILTPGAEGISGAVRRIKEIVAASPLQYFTPSQYENPANSAIHEETTGPEIWQDSGGNVDAVIAGVGTGGTLTGISRYIKNRRKKNIVSVAVEPSESPVISQHLAGLPLTPGQHQIQGIGVGFIPGALDLSLVDIVAQVSCDEAINFTRRLARVEGILSGISSGAAVAAVERISQNGQFDGKTLVVILPDIGERYLSTALFE